MIRDGFSKSVISSIGQTADGYLWLGTESGVLRFDGIHAVPWVPPGGEDLDAATKTTREVEFGVRTIAGVRFGEGR
jgi:ligand-binding sensor domain-containing protein